MKFMLSAVVIVLVANIKTVRHDEVKKVWELVWDFLKSVAGKTKLHSDTGLNIVSSAVFY